MHVVQSLDPARGGPPQVATRLAAAQAGLGHDVTLVCAEQPDRRRAIDESIETLPHAERQIGRASCRERVSFTV